jgi:hypothetical protein
VFETLAGECDRTPIFPKCLALPPAPPIPVTLPSCAWGLRAEKVDREGEPAPPARPVLHGSRLAPVYSLLAPLYSLKAPSPPVPFQVRTGHAYPQRLEDLIMNFEDANAVGEALTACASDAEPARQVCADRDWVLFFKCT